MANIITVLFEQVILTSDNSDSASSNWDAAKGIPLQLNAIYLI